MKNLCRDEKLDWEGFLREVGDPLGDADENVRLLVSDAYWLGQWMAMAKEKALNALHAYMKEKDRAKAPTETYWNYSRAAQLRRDARAEIGAGCYRL